MTNGNDLAYPIEISTHGGMGKITESGLTKREYFAAIAMQGYLSSGATYFQATEWGTLAADALIAELNKTIKP